jgi:DNA-binding NarL/FixJ family response regulator
MDDVPVLVKGRTAINTLNVFIADDSLILRERLVTMLDELAGINVVGQAQTVAEAMTGIQNLKPDVVILDIRMPDGSGLDVLQSVKQGQAAPVVIVLTQYSYPPYRDRCLAAGADYFFDKAAEFTQIPEVLAQLRRGPASDQVPQG